MPVHQLHASYILRLTQRLSRLRYELRDLRSGQVWCFDSSQALCGFLDTSFTDRPIQPGLGPEGGVQRWNADGTAPRHRGGKGERP